MAETTTAEKPASAQASHPSSKPKSSGDKVTVYCKLPNGLRLRIFKMITQHEPVMGGGSREFKIADPYPQEVVVNGNRFRIGEPSTHRIINGYGVTPGVDKEFWEKWLEDNKDTPMVQNHLIFAYADKARGQAVAKEFRDQLSGLEPMAKDDDPRAPRPLVPGVGKVEESNAVDDDD